MTHVSPGRQDVLRPQLRPPGNHTLIDGASYGSRWRPCSRRG
jgi:hypothetical protein